jgi:hypothetical protein
MFLDEFDICHPHILGHHLYLKMNIKIIIQQF